MAIKDIWKSFVNISDDDLDDYENEAAEATVEEPRAKREPAIRKTFDRKASAQTTGGAMKVVIVRPEMFDELANIADHLVQGKTIVLNLETANKEVARRIVDFMSGAAYALSCKLKKVANNTFIIVPEHTDIAGDLILDEFEEQSYYN